MKKSILALFVLLFSFFYFNSAANAEWNFGIGTGISRNYVEGTQGATTHTVGPVEWDVNLKPKDFKAYTKTAFGFGGYATNNLLLFQYSLIYFELQDKDSVYVPSKTTTVKGDFDFKVINFETTVSYPVYKNKYILLLVDAGARYIKHTLDVDVTFTGTYNENFGKKVSLDWIDPLVGITIKIPFTETLSLNNRLNAGYFGSKGTYTASAALSWMCFEHVSVSLNGKYTKVKYEYGNKGDNDWYLYDVVESGVGLGASVHW
jgi:hypothetical protein